MKELKIKGLQFNNKENKYFDYILEHINNVQKGFELLFIMSLCCAVFSFGA